jgi:sugar/nucleoside kinase (ribokinase family)
VKVIGLGDCVVDKYLHLNKMFPGGNALNFSVYAQKLGANSAYLGIMGTDQAGQHIKKTLLKFNIDISHCRLGEGETGYALVNLVDGERVFMGGNGGGVLFEQEFELSDDDLIYLRQFDLIHSSCFSNLETQLPKVKSLSIPISFDFSNKKSSEYLKKICPYINYAFLSCSDLSISDTQDLLVEVVKLGADFALGTRGEAGAYLYYQEQYFYQSAFKVEPVDTLGAGDSFLTAFLLEFNSQKNSLEEVKLKKALAKAAQFAAQICLIEGAFNEGKVIK